MEYANTYAASALANIPRLGRREEEEEKEEKEEEERRKTKHKLIGDETKRKKRGRREWSFSSSPFISLTVASSKLLHESVDLLRLSRQTKLSQEKTQRRHKVHSSEHKLVHICMHDRLAITVNNMKLMLYLYNMQHLKLYGQDFYTYTTTYSVPSPR